MRILSILILTVLVVFNLKAQKEYYNWYFGNKAGVTFNTDPPSALTNGKMYTNEGCASISTPDGRLLFYTDGVSVWDSTHIKMPNGIGLKGGFSSTQSATIIQKPGSSHLFYIFTAAEQNSDDGLQYSEIDMKLNFGKGDIISNRKNIKLNGPMCEKVCTVKNRNGWEYWVVSVKINTDSIFAYRVSSSGVNLTPVVSKTGFGIFGRIYNKELGYLKISPNGKKIAYANSGCDTLAIGNFDDFTGKVSNIWTLNCPNCYGIEFSPSSNYLYITSSSNNFILRYNALTANRFTFNTSKKTIADSFTSPGALQLGPDGKIYISDLKYLSVIHNPDSTNCHPQKKFINLDGTYCSWGLPNFFINSFVRPNNKLNLGNDTIICLGDSITLAYKLELERKIKWNTGDTTNKIIVKKQGVYSAIVTAYDGKRQYDTINITVGPKFKVFIGNDTAFCGKFSHLIKASSGFAKYNWNTGSTAMQINVNSKGIYSVIVLDSNTCPSGDTIAIDQIKKPVIKLSYDSINCKYIFLSTDTIKGLSYLWSTKEITNSIKVDKKGWYSLKAIGPFCSNQDSIHVNQLSQPEVNFGIDTSLCNYELQLSTKEQGRYLWNTGETRPSILINEPGQYWLTVSRNNCSASDTVNVKLCEDMFYYIPSVFTPNGDNINDIFKVYGSNISFVEMEIYNRWGEKLLETSGKDANWDGFYKNELCMESVYFYKVKIKGKKAGSVKYLKGTITLLK